MTPESENSTWLKWGVGLALVLSVMAVALGVLGYAAAPAPADLTARAANTNCFIEQGGNKVVAGSGCEYEFQSGATLDIQAGVTVGGDAGLDLNGVGSVTWDADADTISVASFDDVITTTLGAGTGKFHILVGNLTVGDGTPGVTQDGEDGYIEGTLEVDGLATLDGGADLNAASVIWDADADTTMISSFDDTITTTLGAAAGIFHVVTGNLAVGNGTPTVSLDGEDVYVEGTFEVDGTTNLAGALDALADVDVGTWVNFSAQGSLTIGAGGIITPTGTYQLLDSAGVVTTSTATPISIASRETGDVLILRNDNAADTITVDGTGGTVECKADVVLGADDTLTLVFNGAEWNCLAGYDNS